jgi:hypothetical protein
MAVDDVVSITDTQVANGADLTIRPASGDEWEVTGFVCEDSPHALRASADTGAIGVGAVGGSAGSANLPLWGIRPVAIFLTYDDYLTVNNAVGATVNLGFYAIKTKE